MTRSYQLVHVESTHSEFGDRVFTSREDARAFAITMSARVTEAVQAPDGSVHLWYFIDILPCGAAATHRAASSDDAEDVTCESCARWLRHSIAHPPRRLGIR